MKRWMVRPFGGGKRWTSRRCRCRCGFGVDVTVGTTDPRWTTMTSTPRWLRAGRTAMYQCVEEVLSKPTDTRSRCQAENWHSTVSDSRRTRMRASTSSRSPSSHRPLLTSSFNSCRSTQLLSGVGLRMTLTGVGFESSPSPPLTASWATDARKSTSSTMRQPS